MYNPNNIVIGAALIFLIGYAFFIVRRMYKRKIVSLEHNNKELKKIIETYDTRFSQLSQQYQQSETEQTEQTEQTEETEETEETEDTEQNSVSVDNEASENIADEVINIEPEIKRVGEMTAVVEIINEPNVEHQEAMDLDSDIIVSIKDDTIITDTIVINPNIPKESDSIRSMSVAELRQKLGDLGTSVKGMKKKEMQALLMAM